MDPQHLARLDDDGTVRRYRTRSAGGSTATGSPEGPEVPVSAPVSLFSAPGARSARRGLTLLRGGRADGATIVVHTDGLPDTRHDALSDAWPLPVEPEGLVLTDAWPLFDVDALQLAGVAAREGDAERPARQPLDAE
ncbi:hypothetical protein, partial [Modestobacter versicolor]